MNFLAHFLVAARFAVTPVPAFVTGNALPDLLPLATPRRRLRRHDLEGHAAETAEEAALRAGVLLHLATDAAFHKADAFSRAQADVGLLVRQAPFDGIRVRRFFVSHVLCEMALDAVLLRSDPLLAGGFYRELEKMDAGRLTRWTEGVAAMPLPELAPALARFLRHRFLYEYRDDAGLAEALNRLCRRTRQDTFTDGNWASLLRVVQAAVQAVRPWTERLLEETLDRLPPAGMLNSGPADDFLFPGQESPRPTVNARLP